MATKPNASTAKPVAAKAPAAAAAKPVVAKPAEEKPVAAKPVAKTTAPAKTSKLSSITAEERWRMVAEAAYFIAEKRGFQGGDSSQDWVQAEQQIAALLGKA